LDIHRQVGRTTNIAKISKHILSFYAILERYDFSRVRIVKYEDLVTDAFTVVKDLAEWLGLEVPEENPHPSLGNLTQDDFTGRFEGWMKLDDLQGVFADKQDLWKEKLDEEQVATVETICGQLMAKHQYRQTGSSL
jgi:hypothetical protein